jgi:hypothetical protein
VAVRRLPPVQRRRSSNDVHGRRAWYRGCALVNRRLDASTSRAA